MQTTNKQLPTGVCEELLKTLKTRFEKNMQRHKGLAWASVLAKLDSQSEKLWTLNEMEITGGEPDVADFDKKQGNTFFTIAPLKAPKDAEAFVTTTRRWKQEKNLNRRTAPLIWRLIWVLIF